MLYTLKDKHKNERCFIVATGESLRYTDLHSIEDATLFGLNRAYLYSDIHFDYLFVGDFKSASIYREELITSPTDALVTSEGIYKLLRHPNKHYFFA